MEVADIGGAWILETPGAEFCEVVPPEDVVTICPWAYIAGAAIAGLILGYVAKGRK
jgi:hypothetical protein